MAEIGRNELKRRAIAIVRCVEPDDTFVVEDGFDALADDWYRAGAQDEGRFLGGVDATTFAAIVVPFLLTFLGDVAKDAIKDQAKKAAAALLDKLLNRQATKDDAARLRSDIEAALARSRFSARQKTALHAGFEQLFARVGPPA